jgi:hypothetical protein
VQNTTLRSPVYHLFRLGHQDLDSLRLTREFRGLHAPPQNYTLQKIQFPSTSVRPSRRTTQLIQTRFHGSAPHLSTINARLDHLDVEVKS